MKKLLTFLTLALTLLTAHADPPYATGMAFYKDNGTQLYFQVYWHNIQFNHVYELQVSDDAGHWTALTTVINLCCTQPDSIWVQETNVYPGGPPMRLFRMQEIFMPE